LIHIYVDADACPVRDEVYRVAGRLGVGVYIVSNGSRPIRPPGLSFVEMVMVGDTMDAADDWIAERITAIDICVTRISRWLPVAWRKAHGSCRQTAGRSPKPILPAHSPAARFRGICANWALAAVVRRPSPKPTARGFSQPSTPPFRRHCAGDRPTPLNKRGVRRSRGKAPAR